MKGLNIILSLLLFTNNSLAVSEGPSGNASARLQFDRFNDEDLQLILDGVTTVKLDGRHGQMAVYGADAFPILGGLTNGYLLPLAAGGRYGDGKIIGFARITEESIFQVDFQDEGDVSGENFNAHFYRNLYSWLSSNVSGSSIALIGSDYPADYQNFLTSLQYQLTHIPTESFDGPSPPPLTPHSIVVINYNFPFSRIGTLLNYVESGGSLLIVANHWDIVDATSENKDPTFYLNQFAANHVMSAAGFLCSGEHGQNLNPSSIGSSNNYTVSVTEMETLHFLHFWPKYEEALVTGDFSHFVTAQHMKILSNLFTFIPRNAADVNFASFYEKAKTFVETAEFHSDFSDGQAVSDNGARAKLLLFHYLSTSVLKNEDVVPHPGITFFPNFEPGWPIPGVRSVVHHDLENECVSSRNQANFEFGTKMEYEDHHKSNRRQAKGNPSKAAGEFPGSSVHTLDYIRRWHNTGYYALAGKPVTVQLNSDVILENHSVQIGVHTDRWSYEGNSKFARLPILVVRKYIENNFVEVVSPYGGAIIIQVPYESYSDEGYEPNVTVSGEGAQKSPVFEYGVTTLPEWKETIRNYPGLWTEFKTDSVSYMFPTSEAKLIDNPDEPLSLFTVVMDAFHDFTSTPRTNGKWRKDVIVMDYSSYAGAAHAGYPTVVPKEWKTNFVNTTEIRDQSEAWGMLHEIGHNFQEWDWWAIPGTSETTNNVIVLYIQETLFGHDAASKMEQQQLQENIQTHIENGRPYNEWQGDPWLALGTYYQLKVVYGWGSIRSVLATYAQFAEDDKPLSGQAQTDLWIVTFSLQVKANLANFFQSWGVPLSADGLSSIQHLPESSARMDDLLLGL